MSRRRKRKPKPKSNKPAIQSTSPAAWNALLKDMGLGVVRPQKILNTRGKPLSRRRGRRRRDGGTEQ